jgi:glycosyltransferase involved in cell wall biosynthesis
LVSTIIPAYNAESFLGEALQSALTQAGVTEVIVVDDGSTDKTAEVARSFPEVRYIHQEHLGISVARNRGAQESRGKYLAFLDADDIWVPGKIRAQSEILDATRTDMIFGNAVQFRVREGRTVFEGEPSPAKLAGTMMIRKASWEKTPGFSTEWRVGEFVDWYLKATEDGLTSSVLGMTLLFRRLHENNTGAHGFGRADYVTIVKNSLDRRRASAHPKVE